MRMRRVAGPVLALLLLSGCIQPDASTTPPPAPGATPVFASEEKALAAAEAAYTEYLRISDQITADGGAAPERIRPFVTDAQYQVELSGFLTYLSKGWRTVGSSAYRNLRVQSYSQHGNTAEVVLYVCSDLSRMSIKDGAGNDVKPPGLPPNHTLQISFESSKADVGSLVLGGAEIWNAGNTC